MDAQHGLLRILGSSLGTRRRSSHLIRHCTDRVRSHIISATGDASGRQVTIINLGEPSKATAGLVPRSIVDDFLCKPAGRHPRPL